MTTETRVEYETVEREVQYTVCDLCNLDQEHTVELSVNPRAKDLEQKEILRVYESDDRAMREKKALKERKIQQATPSFVDNTNYGMVNKTREKPLTAKATFDVCIDCLEREFGLELPEDYDSLEIDSDGMVNVTVDGKALLNLENVKGWALATTFWFIFGIGFGVILL